MESIPSDILNLIGEDLNAKDMVKVCSQSTILRKKCSSRSMNRFWQYFIEHDFGIPYDENDAYQEYLRLSWVAGQPFYRAVHIYDDRRFGIDRKIILGIFTSRLFAIESIRKHVKMTRHLYSSDPSIINSFTSELYDNDRINHDLNTWEIEEVYLNDDLSSKRWSL